MATADKGSWDDVGKRFAELKDRLRDHYGKLDPGDAAQERDRRSLTQAMRSVTDQLDRAFTSLGDTLRDPQSKQTMDRAVRSLGEAVAATFEDVAGQIRRKTGRTGDA
jgi:hypothetical protein